MSFTIEEKNKIFKTLRDIKNSKSCPTDVTVLNTCNNPVPVYFCDPSKEFDDQILCAPDGTKIIVVTTYSSTGVPSSIAYNLDQSLYTGDINLLTNCDIDLESDPIIICIDGVSAIQWIIKKNGVPTGDVYYTDKFGVIIPTPTLFTFGECVLCSPAQQSFTGNAATLAEFNSVYVDIPECCSVTITHSAGSITLPSKKVNWVYTQKFDCMLSNYTITSTCDISLVHTILIKTK